MSTAIRYTRFPPRAAAAVPPDAVQAEAPVAEVAARARPGQAGQVASPDRADRLNPLVILLLCSLALPIVFYVGPVLLTPNRFFLLLLFFPALGRWLSGAAGRMRAADFWVIGLCLWVTIAMFVSDGTGTIQFSGMTTMETLGAYLTARAYIRTEAQYRMALRVLGIIILVLVPGAIIESTTGIRIYNRVLDLFTRTYPWADYEKRMNLFRAQTVFEHPIIFGVFTAFCFAPVYMAARATAGRLKAWWRASPVLIATFFSLSSGAFMGVIIQLMLMGWGLALHQVRNRWKILGALAVLAYIAIAILSDRTPFRVLSSYLAFDGNTAYWRVLIFTYGMENVWENPIFGLGAHVGDWKRPDFMVTSSVDNFWLVIAMRYGIPGFVMILGVYFSVLAGLMRARLADPVLQGHRDALAFSFVGLGFAISTVHLWGATFVFMMFMLGASAWLSDVRAAPPVSPAASAAAGGTARRASDRIRSSAGQSPGG